MLAPPKPPEDELEALIKEARARQRRRQAAAVAIVALASAATFIGYSITGGHTPRPRDNSIPPRSGAAASATCGRGRPRLLLSHGSGPPGTVVSVIGCGCPNTVGPADQLSWFNTRSERAESQGEGSPYRRIPVVRTSRTTAEATFVVQRSDSLGRGMLDMWCGGGNGPGNAIGHFTVTPG